MHRDEMNKTFGIMRSLLMSPSTQAWKRLCGYLDRYAPYWHEPMIQEREVHYVRTQLGTWPKEVSRYAQHLWITRALKGKDVPQLEFATAIQLISQEAGEHEIEMLFNQPGLGNMTHIDLRAATVGYESVLAIIEHPWLNKLEVLDMRRSGLSPDLRRRLQDRFEPKCRVLYS